MEQYYSLSEVVKFVEEKLAYTLTGSFSVFCLDDQVDYLLRLKAELAANKDLFWRGDTIFFSLQERIEILLETIKQGERK